MRSSKFPNPSRRPRAAAALLVLLALAGSLLPASQARQNEGRPRRVATPKSNAAAPAQTHQTPTPTPSPRTNTPVGPAVNTQDAPPPPPPVPAQAPPKLRTQPTAEPDPSGQKEPTDEEIEEGGLVTIDTSLVNLHVRVIDRNNKPINDVSDADFRVTENGVFDMIANSSAGSDT